MPKRCSVLQNYQHYSAPVYKVWGTNYALQIIGNLVLVGNIGIAISTFFLSPMPKVPERKLPGTWE